MTEHEPGQPLPERALPQTSIRFFLLMIGVCAIGMYTFRAAIIEAHMWAKIASLVIATAIGCFIAYFLLFVLAVLFTATTTPIAEAVQHSAEKAASRDDSPEISDGAGQ